MSANELPEATSRDTVEALERVFALVRSFAVSGDDGEETARAAAEARRALSVAQPPFALQVYPDAMLRDRSPLPLSIEQLRQAQQLAGACARFGARELVVERVPDEPTLIELAGAIFAATNFGSSARAPQLLGLRFRPLRRIGDRPPPQETAVDGYLAAELEQLCAQVSGLGEGGEVRWSIAAGHGCARKLERCMAAGTTATARVLELARPPWSSARRSVTASFYVGALLLRLQASPLTMRAAVHAMLVLGAHGLVLRRAPAVHAAARSALQSMMAALGHTPADAVAMRVCAILHALSHPEHAPSPLPVAPLLAAAYALESRRVAEPVQLTRLDLQAWLADALGRELHPRWGRALLGMFGPLPVGSHVVADGRLGVVMAPSDRGDPLRPQVLVGGQLVSPEQPVQPYSPFAMAPSSG